jgi:hypothetical protein
VLAPNAPWRRAVVVRGEEVDVLATIEDPMVIRRILTHLGLSLEPGEAVPSRAPPGDDGSMADG